jgi:hypothetical protein
MARTNARINGARMSLAACMANRIIARAANVTSPLTRGGALVLEFMIALLLLLKDTDLSG